MNKPIKPGRPARGSENEMVLRELKTRTLTIFSNDESQTRNQVYEELLRQCEKTALYEAAVNFKQGVGRTLTAKPSTEEIAKYRDYTWPASHEGVGALPWEAAAIGLAIKKEREGQGKRAPSMRLVRWAFHLAQSAPDLAWTSADTERGSFGGHTVARHAEMLAVADLMNPSPLGRGLLLGLLYPPGIPDENKVSPVEAVEELLMWAPWKSEKAEIMYSLKSKKRNRAPIGMLLKGPGGNTPIPANAIKEMGLDPDNLPDLDGKTTTGAPEGSTPQAPRSKGVPRNEKS